MAKKKENELTYLQLPLPEGFKYYKMTKLVWSGLNKRQTLDTGDLSAEKNISTAEAPYLTPSKERSAYFNDRAASGYDPISLFGFDDFLIYIYDDISNGQIRLDYIQEKEQADNK